MSLKHRCDMCQIACCNYDWIQVCKYGLPSGYKTTQQLVRDGVIQRFVKVYEVGGIDFVLRWNRINKPNKSFVCVGRKGYHSNLQTRGNFIVADKELENISSTEIRRYLKQCDYTTPVEKGWLSVQMMNCLQQITAH